VLGYPIVSLGIPIAHLSATEEKPMNILGWILFGFVVGLIARAIMPGKDPLGLIGTTVLGVLGALLAGWLGQSVGWYRSDEGAGFLSATVGAIVVLFLYYLFTGRRSRHAKSHRSDIDRVA
jgi:uncharacterized membrane protein YeaQ/YmgE (transglycosylase-associated protein family)